MERRPSRRTSSRSFPLRRGRCSERLAGAEAYLPLIEALESLLRGPEGRSVGELMQRTAPSWYAQVGFQAESALGSTSSAELSKERLKREIALFLEHLTQDRPLVLFLEDLHWADVSTVDVLTYVADRFQGIETMVLATYRPEDMRSSDHVFLEVSPRLEQRGVLTGIPLRFLRLEDVERYLALEFPGHSFPQGLARVVHERTEGSPLFMVDLARDLRRRDVFSQREGHWTLTKSLETIGHELPQTIRSMIHQKIDQLDTTERSILLGATVQGEDFDGAVVAGALDMDPADVEERLEVIERVHALVRRQGEEELPDGTLTLRYRFVHVLYQNALYGKLKPSRRASLSRAVAQSLIRHHREHHGKLATDLANLFEAARDFPEAVSYFQTSGSERGPHLGEPRSPGLGTPRA